MKKIFVLAIILMITLQVQGAEINLISNNDFENTNKNGTPQDWYIQSFATKMSVSVTNEKVHNGQTALKIENIKDNDVRLFQIIKVKPDTCYCLSGWISTQNVTGKIGANLSIVNGMDRSESITGTQEWTLVKYYFKTSASQNGISIGVRLGSWGSTVKGIAYFDDIRLEPVNTSNDIPVLSDSAKLLNQNQYLKNRQKIFVQRMIVSILIILGVIIGFLVWIRCFKRNNKKN